MKATTSCFVVLSLIPTVALASSTDREDSLCWLDGKAYSIGAAPSIEGEAKVLRCSRVLIIDKEGNEKEVVGWVEGEYKRSSEKLPYLLAFK